MYLESLLKNRKIDFCIVYSNLQNYDSELVDIFLKKLKKLLQSLNHYEFRKKLYLTIKESFEIYFVSEKEENLVFLKEIQNPDFHFRFLICNSLKEVFEKINTVQIQSDTEKTEITETADTFLYFESISPLMDIEKSKELILNHFKYLSEYSYCDIAPTGFLPIVCNIDLAKRIVIQDSNYNWNWSEFFLKNTQTVDLEIFYVEKDYRIYRFRFDLYDERNQKICKNLLKKNINITYEDIEYYLQNEISLFRIAPTWIEIELTNKQILETKIYPKPKEKKENYLSIDKFKKIILDLKEFEVLKSMTLCLGGMGETFFYPELDKILEISVNSKLFKKIYIETFLYFFDEKLKNTLINFKKDIEIIIKLPTLNEKLYEELMGINLLPEIKKNLKELPKDLKVYSEILRIKQVEEELDSYFAFFKESFIQPIIGKYNTYSYLPDYRAVDLEPFEKDYCRNLMFSIYINSEGKIPICRQDIFCKYQNYDLETHSLKEVFFELEKKYKHFIKKEYDLILPLCKNCTDWYVFFG